MKRLLPAFVAVACLGGVGVGMLFGGEEPDSGGDAAGADTSQDLGDGGRTQQILPWISTGANGDPNKVATTDGAREVYSYLRECYPDDASSNEDIYEQTPCFNDRVAELAETTDPGDFFSGIKAVVVARPDVFAVCHDAGHKGSDILLRRFWDPTDDAEEQKTQLVNVFSQVNDTCMSGFIHGLFDTLGYLKAQDASFDIALGACLDASMRDPAAFDCADGMGHAAWESTLDLKRAADLCTKLPDNEKRVVCDGGIIMRMYQHLEREDPWYLGAVDVPGFTVEDWMQKVSSICSEWPDGVERDKGSAEGCWAGTPYLFFKPLYSQLAGDGNDFDRNAETLSSWIKLMGDACESYGPVGADVCFNAWDQYLVMNSLYDEDNIKVMCSKLPPARASTCVDRALKHLADELGRNQAVR